MKAVEIKNLYFNYGSNMVFDDLNLYVEKASFCTILGKGGSGKSTLFRLLSGSLSYDGSILIFNKSIKYALKKNYLGLMSADILYFECKTVVEELSKALENKGLFGEKLDLEIKRISKKTKILKLLNLNISDLSIKEKILLFFALQIIKKPKVLILDNILGYLDNEKYDIIKELQRLNKEGTTIINITNNSEECLYGSDILILNSDVNIYKLNEMSEDDFLNNSLESPFMISLSSKLMFYDLINDNYINMEKLVDDLWQ